MVASSLAYGRVGQILKSVGSVLNRMKDPNVFLKQASIRTLRRVFTGFKHRFTTGEELAAMLYGVKCVIEEYGSLEGCFIDGLNEDDDTILPALSKFVEKLTAAGCNGRTYLLPYPSAGSACKRLNLFLRWMVRHDDVDPGGWYNVTASKLIVPLDTHMHRVCLALGFTERKQPDLRTALEITVAFRRFAPEDPVRYDFALTRLGIRRDCSLVGFIEQWGGVEVVHRA